MGKFEDKISNISKEILLDITTRYYREQEEKSENLEFNIHEIYSINFEATKKEGNFAYAVKKAEEIRQRRLEDQGKTKEITLQAATKNALQSGISAEDIARVAKEEQDITKENNGKEEKDD